MEHTVRARVSCWADRDFQAFAYSQERREKTVKYIQVLKYEIKKIKWVFMQDQLYIFSTWKMPKKTLLNSPSTIQQRETQNKRVKNATLVYFFFVSVGVPRA